VTGENLTFFSLFTEQTSLNVFKLCYKVKVLQVPGSTLAACYRADLSKYVSVVLMVEGTVGSRFDSRGPGTLGGIFAELQ
jgi:hypothetical protein